MTTPTKASSAGYVPGAKDADGSEDPVPTEVLQTTDAAGAGKPRLDPSKQPMHEDQDRGDDDSAAKAD